MVLVSMAAVGAEEDLVTTAVMNRLGQVAVAMVTHQVHHLHKETLVVAEEDLIIVEVVAAVPVVLVLLGPLVMEDLVHHLLFLDQQ
jgi:hypothetical protein